MWATTLQSPPHTKNNKLPGPLIQPEIVPPTKPEEPRIVMPDRLAKEIQRAVEEAKEMERKREEEEARRKAMANAVAALRTAEEHRPVPRPDNFPSIPGAENAKRGLPAGPLGGDGLGALGGDPAFSAYRAQIRRILVDNLIWVQRGSPQALLTFRIDPNGNVLDPKITKSSGNPGFDTAALRAVRKSSPLPLPPPQFAQQIIGEEFSVDFRLDVK